MARAQAPQLAPAAVAPPAEAPAAPAPAQRSLVYSVASPGLSREDGATIRRMVDELVLALTGYREIGKAWQSLVRPDDRIGLKVSTAGGPAGSTHPAVVAAVISGLETAGIPAGNIVIWDRQTPQLRAAGFVDGRNGWRVRGIDPPRGFDPQAVFAAPMLGRLIWGDLSFQGQAGPMLRAVAPEPQISSTSHLARLLSQEVTRIISLPTFSEERGCGLAGALYNVTVPNVDNGRRFSQAGGSSSICDLFNDPRIGPKVTLTIVDGLQAQYAAGPEYDPNYALAHATLYASRDPVALDATLLRRLEGWRKQARLPPLAERTGWVREAQTIGLGNFDEDRVAVIPLRP